MNQTEGNPLPEGQPCQLREMVKGNSDKAAVEALSYCPVWIESMNELTRRQEQSA